MLSAIYVIFLYLSPLNYEYPSFSRYFTAFSRACSDAFLIPVELNVAPLIVSISALCASMILGIISFAMERYAPSSFSADITLISAILLFSIFTSTWIVPHRLPETDNQTAKMEVPQTTRTEPIPGKLMDLAERSR